MNGQGIHSDNSPRSQLQQPTIKQSDVELPEISDGFSVDQLEDLMAITQATEFAAVGPKPKDVPPMMHTNSLESMISILKALPNTEDQENSSASNSNTNSNSTKPEKIFAVKPPIVRNHSGFRFNLPAPSPLKTRTSSLKLTPTILELTRQPPLQTQQEQRQDTPPPSQPPQQASQQDSQPLPPLSLKVTGATSAIAEQSFKAAIGMQYSWLSQDADDDDDEYEEEEADGPPIRLVLPPTNPSITMPTKIPIPESIAMIPAVPGTKAYLLQQVQELQKRILGGARLGPSTPMLPQINALDELFQNANTGTPFMQRSLPPSFFNPLAREGMKTDSSNPKSIRNRNKQQKQQQQKQQQQKQQQQKQQQQQQQQHQQQHQQQQQQQQDSLNLQLPPAPVARHNNCNAVNAPSSSSSSKTLLKRRKTDTEDVHDFDNFLQPEALDLDTFLDTCFGGENLGNVPGIEAYGDILDPFDAPQDN